MNTEKKDRILLVDDEKHLLMSLRDYLVYENFDVVLAQSGEEALAQLEKTTPDLIVLDISMPGMGGVGFLKRISSSDGIPSHPVLVLTARSAMKDFFDSIDVDGFLEKPCEESEFVKKIREILDKRKSQIEQEDRVHKRILLAEDDTAVAASIREAAEAGGYEIEIANSGPEILEKATTIKPDIIVVKEILPNLNGSEVASLIGVMPSMQSVPIILYDETRSGKPEENLPLSHNLKKVKKVLNSADPADILGAVGKILN